MSHPSRFIRLLSLATLVLLTSGCLNHYLIHPRQTPAGVLEWSGVETVGKLRLRLEWARPIGEGPFPAILVHPAANHVAKELRGIVRSLALEGYLALAVDYQREKRPGVYRTSLFSWQEPGDGHAALDLLRAHPAVDAERLGVLGYSQGGIFSLLIAAETDAIDAAVAYYPVTDFYSWLVESDRRGLQKLAFKLVRRLFVRHTGAKDDAELERILGHSSPLQQAQKIKAPVLLIHGDKDLTTPVEQSRQLAERLTQLGREVELIEVPDAGHVFNFWSAERATPPWREALGWFDRHLRPTPAQASSED